MKKVMMVCEAFGGGVFAYVSQLCNDMVDTYGVYLVYSVRPQTPQNYKELIDKRVHLVELKDFSNNSIFNIRNDMKIIKELRKLLDTINPDIIHLHSSIAGGLGRIAFKNITKSVVYTPHGYAHILMGKGLKSHFYKLSEKILGRYQNVTTLTCCESEDIEAAKFTKKHSYIETGIQVEDFKSLTEKIFARKNHKFTVYTLGRICKQKQPKLFNEIAKLVPEAQFVWIGNGELDYELTSSNIKITGWKPRKEALAMAKGADVFILCSLGEAIAMSLIENMYLKKLILVSNVMGNKSVIKNGINGYVCNKPSDYAMRIHNAMDEYPKQLTENAYNDVINIYNTKSMKRKYIDFYNSLIKNSENINMYNN